tara:strand:- start:1107 stop:1442 length:336 start_codon:yes stop_codon:yes gene_type:complete
MNLQSIFQLGLAFFGLTLDKIPELRASIFTQIHEICFHGKGGYQWVEVYNMPIWLRKFTYKKIQDFHKDQNEQSNSQNNKGEKTLVDSTGKVNTPNFIEASKNHNKPLSYK